MKPVLNVNFVLFYSIQMCFLWKKKNRNTFSEKYLNCSSVENIIWKIFCTHLQNFIERGGSIENHRTITVEVLLPLGLHSGTKRRYVHTIHWLLFSSNRPDWDLLSESIWTSQWDLQNCSRLIFKKVKF